MARLVELVQGEGAADPASEDSTEYTENPGDVEPEEKTESEPEEESSPAEEAKD